MNKVQCLLAFIATFSMATPMAQQINADSVWFREHYDKIEVAIPMRDGVKLFTSIYSPKPDSARHPILMERTPYNCSPYGAGVYRDFWSGYKLSLIHI